MFSHFDIILACDRQTVRQTDARRQNILCDQSSRSKKIHCSSKAELTNTCPFVNKNDKIFGKFGPQLSTMQSDLDSIFKVVQNFIQATASSISSRKLISQIAIHKHRLITDAVQRLKHTTVIMSLTVCNKQCDYKIHNN